MRAAEIFAELSKGRASDNRQVVTKSLIPDASDTNREVVRFTPAYADVLPAPARKVLEDYVAQDWGGQGLTHGYLVNFAPLAVLRSSFEYAERNTEEIARSHVELAFEHLRRLIAVDPRQREVWTEAFAEGEVACEKLGAVHLLVPVSVWTLGGPCSCKRDEC